MVTRVTVPPWCMTFVVAAICLLPLAQLSFQLASGDLGPDPAKRLMQGTGDWGLRGLASALRQDLLVVLLLLSRDIGVVLIRVAVD